MNPDLTPYCRPGPSTSRDDGRQPGPADSGRKIQCPPYHYDVEAAGPSTSGAAQLPPYAVPLPAWPDGQGYPSYMAMAVNAAQPSSYIYPPTSSLRLPPAEQAPPDCLDWTINPVKPLHRQFKTTAEPLFTLGYSSTISENWMEGDKGLQYSIKNFTFSTRRTNGSNEPNSSSTPVVEYDSLLVSIPQVSSWSFSADGKPVQTNPGIITVRYVLSVYFFYRHLKEITIIMFGPRRLCWRGLYGNIDLNCLAKGFWKSDLELHCRVLWPPSVALSSH